MLRWCALAILVGGVGFWAAHGSRLGWSQDQVPVSGVDEITGIEFVRYEKRYVPGIEWPAGSAAVAVLLFAASFLFRSNSTHHA